MSLLKKPILCLLLLFLLQEARGQWLRIYHLGVGQGDCTLLIGNDFRQSDNQNITFSFLIDCGNKMSVAKLDTIWKYITDTLHKYTAGRLDYVVVSHFHSDHLGNMANLIARMYNDTAIRPNVRFIDRMAFQTVYGNPVDDCWDYPPSAVINDYLNALNHYFPSKRYRWEANTFFQPLLKNIAIQCLAANGTANGAPFIPPSGPKSENDLSFAFMVTFNGFHYFTGGDIGGGAPYADGETPIATYVLANYPQPFHACCMKVSHHGSGHSTNSNFLSVFAPYCAVIPSALRSFNGTRIPVRATIEAFTAIKTKLHYTYTVETLSPYWEPPVEWLNDVDYYVTAAPGFGKNIQIWLSQQEREKSTLQLLDKPVLTYLECNKPHPAPTLAEEEHFERMTEASPPPAPSTRIILSLPKTTRRVTTHHHAH